MFGTTHHNTFGLLLTAVNEVREHIFYIFHSVFFLLTNITQYTLSYVKLSDPAMFLMELFHGNYF